MYFFNTSRFCLNLIALFHFQFNKFWFVHFFLFTTERTRNKFSFIICQPDDSQCQYLEWKENRNLATINLSWAAHIIIIEPVVKLTSNFELIPWKSLRNNLQNYLSSRWAIFKFTTYFESERRERQPRNILIYLLGTRIYYRKCNNNNRVDVELWIYPANLCVISTFEVCQNKREKNNKNPKNYGESQETHLLINRITSSDMFKSDGMKKQ